MTNQEVLTKAIQRAIERGWSDSVFDDQVHPRFYELILEDQAYYAVIFNHDFAKALWPDDGKRPEDGFGRVMDWQYHLQQMVIADDPIKYLGENLD